MGKLRKALDVAVITSCSLLSMTLAVVAMNAWDSDQPAPLWSEDDLAAFPASEDNGWVAIMQADERRRLAGDDIATRENETLRDTIDDVLDGAISLEEARPGLEERPTGEQFRFRADCREAFARPRFVDSCRSDDDACRVLPVMYCSRELLHDALGAAADGRYRAAEQTARRLLVATAEHGRTARSVVSHAIAQATGASALRLATLLAVRNPSAALRSAIEAFPRDRPSVPHAKKAEYVRMVKTIDRMESDKWSLLLDRGETIALLNRKYETNGMVDRRDGEVAWWLDNAMGDWLVDVDSTNRWLDRFAGRDLEQARAAAMIAVR